MKTTPCCAACRDLLPSQTRPGQRFCSARCRQRAAVRRRRGLPEADPTVRSPDAALAAELPKRNRQLEGQLRTIAKLRDSRDEARAAAHKANVESEAQERRAERAIESMGREQYTQNRQHAGLSEALRQARWDLQQEQAKTERFLASLRKHTAAAEDEQAVPTQAIRRQWKALAVRLARQAASSNLPLGGLDEEVVSTWQRLRKQRQASNTEQTSAAATNAQPGRTQSPRQPRRRNR